MSGVRTGISIHRSAIHCVSVRGRTVVWTHVEPLDDANWREALERALRRVPRSRMRWPRVRIVLGPQLSQLRTLGGLPDTLHPRVLAAALDENSERFFLRGPARLVVSAPMRGPDGKLFAAAFDSGAVATVAAAAAACRVIPECVAASIAALPSALVVSEGGAAFEWGVAEERVSVQLHAGRAVNSHRVFGGAVVDGAAGSACSAPPLRADIAEHGETHAAAFGAAVMDPRLVPALRSKDLRPVDEKPTHAIRIAAAVTLAAAIATWLFAPALVMTRAAMRAESYMAEHGVVQRRTARAVSDVHRTASAVNRVNAFRAQRRSMVAMLGHLTDALPDSTAVTSLRVDSLGGNMVLMSPRVMPVLAALLNVSDLEAVQSAGPVTREVIGGRELERLTVRFRFRQRALRNGSARDQGKPRYAQLRANE